MLVERRVGHGGHGGCGLARAAGGGGCAAGLGQCRALPMAVRAAMRHIEGGSADHKALRLQGRLIVLSC